MNGENSSSAQSIYNTICEMFDEKRFKYTRHDEDLVVSCTVSGEDIPMEMLFFVRAEQQVVQLISPMPFRIPDDKLSGAALAVCAVNDILIDGSFDLDLSNGRISFRMTQSFAASHLSKELFDYMLVSSAKIIDDYNDKFLMLGKGVFTYEDFMDSDDVEDI